MLELIKYTLIIQLFNKHNNKTMNKALLQLVKPHLLLLTLCLSTYVSAESYETNDQQSNTDESTRNTTPNNISYDTDT